MDKTQRSTASADTFCSNPVAKQKVAFPESLAGRTNTPFDMYSGYVNVTDQDWLFYWFFGTADGNPNAPLIIWTNGGIFVLTR